MFVLLICEKRSSVMINLWHSVCLSTFRIWKETNLETAPLWNSSSRLMATFKASSKISRCFFLFFFYLTLPCLLSLEIALCLYSAVYVWAWFVFPLRNHCSLPLMQQKCTRTPLSVFDCSIKRMKVWIWMRCGNRIMVMYGASTQTVFLQHISLS